MLAFLAHSNTVLHCTQAYFSSLLQPVSGEDACVCKPFSFFLPFSPAPLLVQNHKYCALLFWVMRRFGYLYCGEEPAQCQGNQMITLYVYSTRSGLGEEADHMPMVRLLSSSHGQKGLPWLVLLWNGT